MENVSISRNLDKNLIRRLTVLKIWCDSNGVHCENTEWHTAHTATTFDPEYWLRDRNENEVDLEDIGTLAAPTPTAKDLLERIKKNYAFLRDLDETEKIISKSDERDRKVVLQALRELPDKRFDGKVMY